MRAKSEIETEEVLRSRALDSADDLDCPTPIVTLAPRFALGSQHGPTRIVDAEVMYARARASVAPRAAFDPDPPTAVDARDPFDHVSTIEKDTATVDRTVEAQTTPRAREPATKRITRQDQVTAVAPVKRARDVCNERREVATEPLLLLVRKPREMIAVPVPVPRAELAPRPLPAVLPKASRSIPVPQRPVLPARPATTIARRAGRMVLGALLIATVGAVAMGATYWIARDVQRDAGGTTVSETRTLPVYTPPTSGTLRFSIEPADAKIRIDDVLYGATSVELPLGAHQVEVARRGYATWRRTIVVTATTADMFVVLAPTSARASR